MSDIIKIPAEAKEIIKHKRTGKVYASKDDFNADVADPNTDTTVDDFRQDLEIKVTKVSKVVSSSSPKVLDDNEVAKRMKSKKATLRKTGKVNDAVSVLQEMFSK